MVNQRSELARLMYCAEELDACRGWLSSYLARRYPSDDFDWHALRQAKRMAVARNEQNLASAIWCLEQIGIAQLSYLKALVAIGDNRFYAAWALLDRAECAVRWVSRHFDDPEERYGLALLRDRIPRLQALFPYRKFFSAGFTIQKASCSICGAARRIRNTCGHKDLELYDGKMCGRVVEQWTPYEVSIVDRPQQKVCVVFVPGARYNYALVKYLVSALETPWTEWSLDVEIRRRRQPKLAESVYRGLGRNDPCGCRSGRKFKKCCGAHEWEEFEHHIFSWQGRTPLGVPVYQPSACAFAVDEPAEEEDALALSRDDFEAARYLLGKYGQRRA